MQEIRSVCVVGAGAIGSLFAGHLGTQVAQIKVLTRRKEHAAQLNARGLKVAASQHCRPVSRPPLIRPSSVMSIW